MKKILLLAIQHFPYFDRYQEVALQNNAQIDIVKNFEGFKIEYKDAKKAEIFLGNEKLSSYNLIYFHTIGRNAGPDVMEKVLLISKFCKDRKIPIIDKALTYTAPWIDRKSFEYLCLSNKNLPIIESFFLNKDDFQKEKFKYPLIAKTTNSSQGAEVFLAKDKKELDILFNKFQTLMIQKYIENDGDIRVFIIGKKIIAAIKRHSQNEKEFRNNASLGGRTEIYKLNRQEKKIALAAAKALNYQITGVDLIYKNKEVKIMEVNRSPQFQALSKSTGIDIAEKIAKYLIKQAK